MRLPSCKSLSTKPKKGKAHSRYSTPTTSLSGPSAGNPRCRRPEIGSARRRRGSPSPTRVGHAKDELHLRRCAAYGDVVAEIGDYVRLDHCNNWRPQAGLGKMTHAEFREYLLTKPICLPVPLAAVRENGKRSAALPVSQ